VCALPWVVEMEINPFLADESGCIAVNARVTIDPDHLAADPRFSHMAIHPYPARLEHVEHLRGGQPLRIRPIRPEDAAIELAFVDRMSERSRYMRFFSAGRGLTPAMLVRLTQVDYDRELALIALSEGEGRTEQMWGSPVSGPIPTAYRANLPSRSTMTGTARRGHDTDGTPHGGGARRGIPQHDRQRAAENDPMLKLAARLGFKRSRDEDDPTLVRVVRALV